MLICLLLLALLCLLGFTACLQGLWGGTVVVSQNRGIGLEGTLNTSLEGTLNTSQS